MKPMILGYKGSIGSRYVAILETLGVDYIGVEVGDDLPSKYDAIIIATPTHLHGEHLMRHADDGVPILVEKPLATDLRQALEICDMIDEAGTAVRMVNQYRHIPDDGGEGDTLYDYFKTGADGLYWDTISLIAIARGPVVVKNKSPVWRCTVNGLKLSHSLIENAYIDMVQAFLEKPPTAPETGYMRMAHKKVARLIETAVYPNA